MIINISPIPKNKLCIPSETSEPEFHKSCSTINTGSLKLTCILLICKAVDVKSVRNTLREIKSRKREIKHEREIKQERERERDRESERV
jgi:hypothetical protein